MPLFLIDENLSPRLAAWLRKSHYKAKAVRDAGLKGKSDEEIIAWVQKNKAILITSDLDFGEFFYWKNFGAFGVIILRSRYQSSISFEKILTKFHTDGVLKDIRLAASLLVADEKHYRWRKFKIEQE